MEKWIYNTDKQKNTDVPTPRLQVVAKVSKWEKYKCVDVDGVKMICGYGKEKDCSLFTFQKITTPVILYALVDLANNLKTKQRHLHADINENIIDSDIELILKFCRSYGLPFWSDTYTANITVNGTGTITDIAQNTILRPIVPFASQNMFPVASFISGLKMLQTDFIKVVMWNKWQDDTNIYTLINKVPKTRLHALEKASDLYTPNLNPFVTYWDNENLEMALHCENLVHLAVYYLCIISQSCDYTGGYVRKCKKCGSMFITPQSRQQFCKAPCTKQSYYAMIKRKENKA